MTKEVFSAWLCTKLTKKTQAGLARELGVNRSTINHWCSNSRLPSGTLKEAISKSSLFESHDDSLIFILLICHNQEMQNIRDKVVDAIMSKPLQSDGDIEVLTDWVEHTKELS